MAKNAKTKPKPKTKNTEAPHDFQRASIARDLLISGSVMTTRMRDTCEGAISRYLNR